MRGTLGLKFGIYVRQQPFLGGVLDIFQPIFITLLLSNF
jgi:hypothetical protein